MHFTVKPLPEGWIVLGNLDGHKDIVVKS